MVDTFTAMMLSALDALDDDVTNASADQVRARLAAEVKVKRAVVDQHQQTCGEDHVCGTCGVPYPCPTLRLHASSFEDHALYEKAWAIPHP